MATYDFAPKADQIAEIADRRRRVRVWRVELAAPLDRLFCTTEQAATVRLVDMGVPDAGLLGGRSLVQRPTDRDGVWLMEFGTPVSEVAVEHQLMRGWMAVLRANGARGRYRECGTDTWYEF